MTSCGRPIATTTAGRRQWRTLQYLALARLTIAIGLVLAVAALGATVPGWSTPG